MTDSWRTNAACQWLPGDPVPSWVHMAEVPPPTDEEPWAVPVEEPRPRRWPVALVAVLAVALIVRRTTRG